MKTVASNKHMDIVVHTEKEAFSRMPKLMTHARTALTGPAVIAAQYVERWGMVAGMPDGEDSTGRQQLRLSTKNELVSRALDIAEELYAQADARGFLVQLPEYESMREPPDEGSNA